jgi:hypothetical protein
MSSGWFVPKSHGYGATPANWKGWAATFGFIAVLAGLSLLALGWQPDPATGPDTTRIVVWALAVVALTAAFVALARAKTDGQWRWRWGK